MREVLQNYEGGVKIGGVRYFNLRFTDDITLMCTSKSELLELLKQIKEISKKRDLLLNTKKTKIMVVDSNRVDIEEFMLGEEKIEEVDNFVYLGSVIDTSCKSSKEIRKMLAMAKCTVQSMLNSWKSGGVSAKLRLRLLHATAFAVYRCESWTFTETDGEKIGSFEMWCYRRLLRVLWTDKRTNQWVLDKIGTSLVLRKNMILRKKRFFGHIIRKGGMEMCIIEGKVEGKRRRGRPLISWASDIVKLVGGSLANAVHQAVDREGRRALVMATAAHCALTDFKK